MKNTCKWCGRDPEPLLEDGDWYTHTACNREMEKENVKLVPNKFGAGFALYVSKERMKILLNENDIAKVEYFKIKNRDTTKLTQIQLQNKELNEINQLPNDD